MRKILLVAVTCLALLLGVSGATTAASAPNVGSLDYGTWVRFDGNWVMGDEISPNAHIRVWTMNGAHNHIGIGENSRNVAKICPPDHDHRMTYVRPTGVIINKDWGVCQDMTYAAEGTYLVYLDDRD